VIAKKVRKLEAQASRPIAAMRIGTSQTFERLRDQRAGEASSLASTVSHGMLLNLLARGGREGCTRDQADHPRERTTTKVSQRQNTRATRSRSLRSLRSTPASIEPFDAAGWTA
jgi:hypothetical protein